MGIFEGIQAFLQALGLWTIIVVTIIKVLTSIVVAVQDNVFKFNQLDDMFKNDFMKLGVVVLLVVLASGQTLGGFAPTDLIVTAFIAWEGAAIAGNLAKIFPFMESVVPKFAQDIAKPQVTVTAQVVPVAQIDVAKANPDIAVGDVVQVKEVTKE